MKQLPSDPFALHARSIDALCADLFDIGAGKSSTFQRTDALRQVLTEQAAAKLRKMETE